VSETWWEYVQRITGHAQQKEIAEATGIEQSRISRWKLGKSTPKAEAAVAVARGYNRPPVEALIAAGYLTTEDIDGVVEISVAPADLPSDEIVAQVGSLVQVLRGRIPNDTKGWSAANWRRAEPPEEAGDISDRLPRLGQG
jgi:transcriptional regulator with XRE-family HTH domain